MSSSSQPRQFPYTNDVGVDYDRPEKPPIEDETPQVDPEAPSPVSPLNTERTALSAYEPVNPNYASSSNSRTLSNASLGTQPPPFNAHQPNRAFTVPNLSTRKLPKFDRFAIPTRNTALSSGFPYDPRVYDLISPDEWHLLSSDIVNASKLTFTEDFAAWSTGITTGTLTAPFILVGGPVAGYYAGRAVHRNKVVKTVKERLDRDGDLRSVLRRWNEQKFEKRGFTAWLELPVDGGEIKIKTEAQAEKKPKSVKKAEKKIAKRFRVVIIPNSENAEHGGAAGYGDGVPWSPVSPVSPGSVPLGEMAGGRDPVEVLGNEFRDPVEAMGREHRDPVELENLRLHGEKPEEAVADGLNSTPVRSETTLNEVRVQPRERISEKEEEGIGKRYELA